MGNTSTSSSQNQSSATSSARRIDQLPDWLAIVLIVLLALALLGVILAFV